MSNPIELPPNASQLIEGLRDTGYDILAAVADIVDNSIDAEAARIAIALKLEPTGTIHISIADNGCGMSADELQRAMTYGALPTQKNPKRLGHFGLGLKTASTAFCRKLVVVSRTADAGPCKGVWDLDHVARVNKWELLVDTPRADEFDALDAFSSSGSGTVVTWEKIDRVLGEYTDLAGAPRRKALKRLEAELIEHLAMVYQRFLDPNDARARNVEVSINGMFVPAWDPFQAANPLTELVADKNQSVELANSEKREFKCRAFVLPNKNEYANTPQGKAQYARSRTSNDTQGIYIYRENRLIHQHDWLKMFSKEPHISLLRVEFSFGHELDSFFRVDIKKSRIELAQELYDWLKNFLSSPRNAAEQRYRSGQKALVTSLTGSAHAASNTNIGAQEAKAVNSTIAVVDAANGTVDVTNPHGLTRLRIILEEDPNAKYLHVKTEDSLEDGFLWLPALINSHHAVKINRGHPYYRKVYVPNLSKSVTIQGIDALLWAICEAELSTINPETKSYFELLRREVSRILRHLVADLPEPILESPAVEESTSA